MLICFVSYFNSCFNIVNRLLLSSETNPIIYLRVQCFIILQNGFFYISHIFLFIHYPKYYRQGWNHIEFPKDTDIFTKSYNAQNVGNDDLDAQAGWICTRMESVGCKVYMYRVSNTIHKICNAPQAPMAIPIITRITRADIICARLMLYLISYSQKWNTIRTTRLKTL